MAKSARNTATKTGRNVVSFELPPAMLRTLQDDADTRGLKSHHLRAREIIMEFLSSDELGELRESVSDIDSNVSHLGDLIRRVAYSVIVHAANRSSKEANEWIREHMPKSP